MKCPLRKQTHTTPELTRGDFQYLRAASGWKEEFLDCIKEDCTAWNKEEKICNYLSGKRNVEVRM